MENKRKPQRQAGKSSMSDLVATPIFAIVMIGAVEIASSQQAQAGTNYLASDTDSSYHSGTELIAAQSSRQTMTIFAPKVDLINYQPTTTGTDKKVISSNRYIYGAGHRAVRYDGLIEPNTTALAVNKLRLLLESVKTRPTLFFMLDQKLTKLIGVIHHG